MIGRIALRLAISASVVLPASAMATKYLRVRRFIGGIPPGASIESIPKRYGRVQIEHWKATVRMT